MAEPTVTTDNQTDQPDVAPLNPQEQGALDFQFSYRSPNPTQVSHMKVLRGAAKHFAEEIVRYCPRSADRSAALRKVREAVMMANASIVLEGQGLP